MTLLQVQSASAGPVVSTISAGGNHTCALTTTGGLRCAGYNGNGQLGNGTTLNSASPLYVSGLASGVMATSAGGNHTCAVTTSGAAKCWGYNSEGQLGTGTTINNTKPLSVSGLVSGVAAISAGGKHTCALTTAGGAKCWGDDLAGQLGNGTTTDSSIPLDVSGLTSGVAAISAGGNHTCAVTTSGAAMCWGSNSNGQLGDGTTTDSSIPLNVTGLTSGVAAISAGGNHTCAVTTSGSAMCWGSNSNGQLGNATVSDSSIPLNVTGLTSGVAAISAGGNHTCAVTTSGAAMCWGSNPTGQLGNATVSDSSIPLNVTGLTSGVAAISAGGSHTCALTIGGGAKCWGSNATGQVGDGTTTTRLTPVNVSGLPGSPRLSSFVPNTGPVGTTVTITGLNLDHTTAVSFNGVAAPFTVVSSTIVTATVPTGASSGKVKVTTPAGTATNSTNFTVTIIGGPTYVTLQFGRTQWVGTQDCVPLPGMIDLGTVATELQSRGYVGVGAVVLDSTSDGSRQCIGRYYQSSSWQDIASLQAMGWSFVSAGRSYVDLTQLTPDLQYADSCGSLPDFAARGIDASGEFAYPDNHSTTGLQTDIVSTCFDWGRLYQAVGVNTLAGSVAPWFQVSHSLTGGRCNDPTRACYLKAGIATQRYQLPARLGTWLSGLKPDQWAVLQGYRFVSGSQLKAWPTWDCTSADTKAHWTSQGEPYCWNDYLTIIGRMQPGTIVTDPHSVAVAWGR